MANAEGGTFVLGLDDPQRSQGEDRIYGVSEAEGNVSEILNLLAREITPPLTGIDIQWLPVTNREGKPDRLLVIEILPSVSIHSIRSGETYLRRGSSNRKLTAEEILRLKYAKGEVSVESEPAPEWVTLEDLDEQLLQEFRRGVGSAEEDVILFLRRNGLTWRDAGREERLNRAAVLLFGRNPSVLLRSKCGIKIVAYYGKEASYTGTPNLAERPVSIEGPLLVQIRQAFGWLTNWLARGVALTGPVFARRLRYPDFALHEAITNAVIHRDYSIRDDIQIRVFDNRIEFDSPGALPGRVTVENIRTERFARNPIILRTLSRFENPPNLDIGEGVKRIYESMKQANLIDPVYQSSLEQNRVVLTLYHEERAPYWDQIVAFLEEHGSMSNADLRRLTGIEDTVQVSRILRRLLDLGLLRAVGTGKRNRRYVRSNGGGA